MYRGISTSKVVEFFKSGTAVVKEHYKVTSLCEQNSVKLQKLQIHENDSRYETEIYSSGAAPFFFSANVRYFVARLSLHLSSVCLSV